jgi:uncharacterized membrane-anchored protein YitT (DUF2179 family)
MFSLFTDLFGIFMPSLLKPFPLSNDLLLNTVYGGILGGVGGGLIYRAGSTMGGTGIIGRLIQQKTGKPLNARGAQYDAGGHDRHRSSTGDDKGLDGNAGAWCQLLAGNRWLYRQTRTMITCTIYRPQLNDLKRVLAEVDPNAFMTIAVSHQAIGQGFMSFYGNQRP